MRGKRLVHLLKSIELLSRPQGATIKDLCVALAREDRNAAYRAIRTIEDLGFPVYDLLSDDGKTKCWKFDESYLKRLPNVSVPDYSFTQADIVSLYLLRAQASASRGNFFEKRLDKVFERLDAFVPEGLSKKLQKIGSIFLSADNNTKDYSGKEGIIDELASAIIESVSCDIEYNSFSKDKVVSFRIDPLHIFEYASGLYAFYRSTEHGDVRKLAVERIQAIKLTNNHFNPPSCFDAQETLDSAFELIDNDPISVSVAVSSAQARYVKERIYFQNQTIDEIPDGSIIVHLETSGRWDVIRWVLAMGDGAQILSPPEIRREIQSTIEKMRASYL